MNPTLKGATRSKTVYLGLAVAILGYLQANIGHLSPFIKPEYLGLANVLLGASVIVVRFVTDQSLAAKVQ